LRGSGGGGQRINGAPRRSVAETARKHGWLAWPWIEVDTYDPLLKSRTLRLEISDERTLALRKLKSVGQTNPHLAARDAP
jgi:hypothetical protein